MSRNVAIALVLFLLTGFPSAHAWAPLGHQLVGALAEQELTPEAKRAVTEILQGESTPTLAGVAAWADALRGLEPERFRSTSHWHYVSTPSGTCQLDRARDCPAGGCVVAAIEDQRKILLDRTRSTDERREALKFVVHFVGDIHQPFHANNRGDQGGNRFQISLRTKLEPEAYARDKYRDGVMGTNLHAIWDYYILASAELDLAAYANKLNATPLPSATKSGFDPEAWAAESCGLIDVENLYPRRHKMTGRYLKRHRALAEQRTRVAGHRLALLLNQVFAAEPVAPKAAE